MSKYRTRLPQLQDRAVFMTDGGLETTLIFHDKIELPYFAAFHLLQEKAGTAVLRRYYDRYAKMAIEQRAGLVLESPTWRANSEWAAKLGYTSVELADANRRAIGLMLEIRAKHETSASRMVISGNIGPRGDGYKADKRMTMSEAQAYHAEQIGVFAQTDADLVAAFTMNYVEEAIGVVRAAKAHAMPVVISFTLETDGRLPSGDSLTQAIARTDAETFGYPAYYMINCAHPTHFDSVLQDDSLLQRIRGLRTNASRRSHAELDESVDLDAGDPIELGHAHVQLYAQLPKLSVVGGCCGTDHRHVQAIVEAISAREKSDA
ncbi:MAG TPA: homocysteine S-methyltransferase family protein [Steroidobacteraceae bacterium]|nr:homocysteine S-methyltransferase family protein [Steroidobacteraceae bacterium]